MSLTLLKRTLSLVLNDTQIATRNAVLADATLKTELLAQLDALTADTMVTLAARDAEAEGRIIVDATRNQARVDTNGYRFALSSQRDRFVNQPTQIRRRNAGATPTATPTDGIRYLAADTDAGVVLLSENLEVVRVFPGFKSGTDPYDGPTCAATATIGVDELIAIASPVGQVVHIYNFTTGALVATIGTGVAGLPEDAPNAQLTSPYSVTWDAPNSRLFIACRGGGANTGDPTDVGFVAEFNMAIPAAPAFLSYVVVGDDSAKLAYGRCIAPSDVLFVDDALFVSNGAGDVARFERTDPGDPWLPTLSLEAIGAGYVLGAGVVAADEPEQWSLNALDVITDGTETRLLVAVSGLGTVETFRLDGTESTHIGQWETSVGKSGCEMAVPFQRALPPQAPHHRPAATLSVLNIPTGVVGDVRTLPGDTATSLLAVVSDRGDTNLPEFNGRLQQFNLSLLLEEGVVAWEAMETATISIDGWSLVDGDLPYANMTLEVRIPEDDSVTPVVPAGDWLTLSRDCAGQFVGNRLEFRLRVAIRADDAVRAYVVKGIRVHATIV